jgi:hypothetical protein
MRYRWHPRLGLFAAIGALAAAAGNTAMADIRSFVAVRQELRAELLACMSDGQLDARERSLLEQKAAQKLSPGALAAFQATLDRMEGTTDPPVTPITPRQSDLPASVRSPSIDPTVPVIWSEEGPEIPVLNVESTWEDDPAVIEAALGDDYWEVDEATYRTPSVESANTPLTYTSRVANEMLGDTMILDDPGGVIYEGSCFESGCMPPSGPCGLDWIQVSATADAFQGPMDLDGLNANFGVRVAVNGALPISRALGIGLQAGTSGAFADFHGTQYTGSRVRSQNFTTVGIFQRLCLGQGAIKYGFAFDWLFDDYYTSFTMSQWRVKLGWEVSSVAEIGLWSTIPNDGDDVELGADPALMRLEQFKPFSQGALYWTRCWTNGTTTTAYVGIADEPGEWVFGGDARIPMGGSLAFIGNLHYILPSAGGMKGQEEETWNLGLGFEWTPSPCANRCRVGKFTPLFRLADNGTMAVRRY